MLNICSMMFILISHTLANQKKGCNLNVGTVLFSHSDLNKTHWKKSDIGILKARRFFQTILPPSPQLSAVDTKYIDDLVTYFKTAYTTIRIEATDHESDHIMTTALSDTIGGYLKAWVLPATKFAYYNGSISQDNVTKLYEIYSEIKRYLKTDGEKWHKPKIKEIPVKNISKTSSQSQIPVTLVSKSKLENPCSNLAFLEKTPNGLCVPIPRVDWQGESSKLLLPLRNQSIYSMDSTRGSQALFDYYVLARDCLIARSPMMLQNFEDKFQYWLDNDILPHLGDDRVYLALGNVLALMKETRAKCTEALDKFHHKYTTLGRKFHLPIDLYSKKMMVIIVLVCVELLWCLLAFLCIWFSKRRKNKDASSNVYLFIEPPHRRKQDKSYNTLESMRRRPYGLRDSAYEMTSEETIAAENQTDIETIYRRRCPDPNCTCGPPPCVYIDTVETETKYQSPKFISIKDHKSKSNHKSVHRHGKNASYSSKTALPADTQSPLLQNAIELSNLESDKRLTHRKSKHKRMGSNNSKHVEDLSKSSGEKLTNKTSAIKDDGKKEITDILEIKQREIKINTKRSAKIKQLVDLSSKEDFGTDARLSKYEVKEQSSKNISRKNRRHSLNKLRSHQLDKSNIRTAEPITARSAGDNTEKDVSALVKKVPDIPLQNEKSLKFLLRNLSYISTETDTTDLITVTTVQTSNITSNIEYPTKRALNYVSQNNSKHLLSVELFSNSTNLVDSNIFNKSLTLLDTNDAENLMKAPGDQSISRHKRNKKKHLRHSARCIVNDECSTRAITEKPFKSMNAGIQFKLEDPKVDVVEIPEQLQNNIRESDTTIVNIENTSNTSTETMSQIEEQLTDAFQGEQTDKSIEEINQTVNTHSIIDLTYSISSKIENSVISQGLQEIDRPVHDDSQDDKLQEVANAKMNKSNQLTSEPPIEPTTSNTFEHKTDPVTEIMPSCSSHHEGSVVSEQESKSELLEPQMHPQKQGKECFSKRPCWEIIINQPKKDLLDITGKLKLDIQKQSKIPKRTLADAKTKTTSPVSFTPPCKGKSQIPQLKRKVVDDSVVEKRSKVKNKLNTTL